MTVRIYVDAENLQDGTYTWAVAGGTADAITATYSPALPSLVDGQMCYVRATAANTTTAPTFAPNGLTAHTVTKSGGAALAIGDIAGSGHELILRYNLANTHWELLNPATATSAADLWSRPVSSIINDPPASPSTGDRYLIGTSPTGDWASYANQVTEYFSDGWHFSGAPSTGQTVYVGIAEYQYSGSAWAQETTLKVGTDTLGVVFSFDSSQALNIRPNFARRGEIRLGPNDVDGTADTSAAGELTILGQDDEDVGPANQTTMVLFGYRNGTSTTEAFVIRSQAFGTGTQLPIYIDSLGGEFNVKFNASSTPINVDFLYPIRVIGGGFQPTLTLGKADDDVHGTDPALDFADGTENRTYRIQNTVNQLRIADITAGKVRLVMDENGYMTLGAGTNGQTTKMVFSIGDSDGTENNWSIGGGYTANGQFALKDETGGDIVYAYLRTTQGASAGKHVFYQPMKLSSAAVAETPTATHTISGFFDSGGTQYKLLAVAA